MADIAETLSVVTRTKALLVGGSKSTEDYTQQLSELGKVVSLSTSNDEFRINLSSNPTILEDIEDIITESWNFNIDNETLRSLYVRLFRGCLLLIRSIVASNQTAIDLPLVLLSLQHFNQKFSHSDPLFHKSLVVYLQAFSNITQNVTEERVEGMDNLLGLINEVFFTQENSIDLTDDEVLVPFLSFVNNIFTNLIILYDLFLNSTKFAGLLKLLLNEFLERILNQDIDPNVPHSAIELLLIKIFQKMVSHESYSKWFFGNEDSEDFNQILKINQLIITEKEDWNNYQLTAILSWLYDLFTKVSKQSQELLVSEDLNKEPLSTVHLKLVMTLDILSDLGKFDTTKQFLTHYNAMEELINLLRAVHENVERKTLKKKIEPISTNNKEFPQVKSLIIEIIANLVYQSFELQEKARELHGLELVLSNCMIDDNDPYIKERSIICLKLLLENNPKNQEFVASLEAQKTYDDQALRDVGYEVEIQDGKLKLKQTEEASAIRQKLQQQR